MKRRPAILILLMAVALAVCCGGCRLSLSPQANVFFDISTTSTQSMPARGIKNLQVTEINGGVNVQFEQTNHITITATKRIRANGRKNLKWLSDNTRIVAKPNGDTLELRTEYPRVIGRKRDAVSVSYTIVAPRGFAAEISTVNGGVAVGAGASDIKVSTQNGSVSVVGGGKVPANVHVTNGRVEIIDVYGYLRAKSVNGRIVVRNEMPPTDNMHIETVNGSVTLGIPASSDVAIKGRTVNGGIDVTLPVKGTRTGKHLFNGKLKNGKHEISLKTVNGTITVANASDVLPGLRDDGGKNDTDPGRKNGGSDAPPPSATPSPAPEQVPAPVPHRRRGTQTPGSDVI